MIKVPKILVVHTNNSTGLTFTTKLTKFSDGYHPADVQFLKIYPSTNWLELFSTYKPSIIVFDKNDVILPDELVSILPLTKDRLYKCDFNSEFEYSVYECAQRADSLKSQQPYFSICTPTYNTKPSYLDRLYNSLLGQEFVDWEWVIYDTSSSKTTRTHIDKLALMDPRIKVISILYAPEPSNIGYLKRECFMSANGNWLIEMDHDDELMPHALKTIYEGISAFTTKNRRVPGFVYSHAFEVNNGNGNVNYGEGFAYGLGKKIPFDGPYGCKWYNAAAPICSKSLRNIVGIPNHVRIWNTNLYHELNGHNENLGIADDYELVVRSFLKDPHGFLCIDAPLYIQFMHGDNSQENVRLQIHWFCSMIEDVYHNMLTEVLVKECKCLIENVDKPREEILYSDIPQNEMWFETRYNPTDKTLKTYL